MRAHQQDANEPECIPWGLYDTQSIATGTAGPLVYYQTINSDKTLSNMEGPGQLPDPQFLVVQYVAADMLVIPAATALAAEPNTAWSDLENVLKKVRGTFEISMSNKLYGPFPLMMCQGLGGTTGAGYGLRDSREWHVWPRWPTTAPLPRAGSRSAARWSFRPSWASPSRSDSRAT